MKHHLFNTALSTFIWILSVCQSYGQSVSYGGLPPEEGLATQRDTLSVGHHSLTAIHYSPDGYTIFGLSAHDDAVYAMELAKPYDPASAITTLEEAPGLDVRITGPQDAPEGMDFSPDGTKLYIGYTNMIAIFQYTLSVPWDLTTATLDNGFLADPDFVSITPTGVVISDDGTTLFVSDPASDRIHQIALNTPYNILSNESYSGHLNLNIGEGYGTETDVSDLTFSADGRYLFVIGNGAVGGPASHPKLLRYRLGTPFDLTGTVIYESWGDRYLTVSLSLQSNEAIAFSPDGLVCTTSFNWGPSRQITTTQYALPYNVGSRDDIGEFHETAFNDGLIAGSLRISLTGDSFVNEGAYLSEGEHYSIANLPAGLTPSMLISEGGDYATLVLQGQVNLHTPANDIIDLDLSFENAALVSGDASALGDTKAYGHGLSLLGQGGLGDLTFYIHEDAEMPHELGEIDMFFASAGDDVSYSTDELFEFDSDILTMVDGTTLGDQDSFRVGISVMVDDLLSWVYATVHVLKDPAPPTAVNISKSKIEEGNEIGAVIGILSSEDPNIEDSFTYQIETGSNDYPDNEHFSIDGDTLKAAISFDFSNQSTHDILVATSDGTHLVQQELTITILEEKQDQTITFDPLDDVTYGDIISLQPEASASSGLTVSFRSSDETIAQVINGLIYPRSAGTVTITATQPGNDFYNPAEVFQTLTVHKTERTVTFEALEDRTFAGHAVHELNLPAGTVTNTSSNPNVAVIVNGYQLWSVGAGTSEITISYPGNNRYYPASATQTFTVHKAQPNITIQPIADKLITDEPFELIAGGVSTTLQVQGPAYRTAGDPPILNLSGQSGVVTIIVGHSGDNNYYPETVVETFSVLDPDKTGQTITFGALDEKTFGDADFQLAASSSSGLMVSFSSSDEAVAQISAGTLSIKGAGTATIIATQEGDQDYNPSAEVQTLMVSKASQTISFDAISDQNLSVGSLDLIANASSNLAVNFELVAGDGMISEGTLFFNNTGTFTVTATQSGSVNYEAADPVTHSFEVINVDQITWTGTEWSNEIGPGASESVSIEGDFAGAFVCDDLTVQSGNTLTVDGTLEVHGDLTNYGTLMVASGSSLLTYDDSSIADNIIFERNTRYADGKYSFVSTPVEQDASITGADLGLHVYRYDESASSDPDALSRWSDTSSEELVPGRGYTQANQQLIEFIGTPNDGTITYTASATHDGYHLVGNPYPAAIDVDAFIDGNSATTETIYIWDDNGSDTGRGSNSDYIVVTKSGATDNNGPDNESRWDGHIGSMQGFFIQMDGSAGTVTFTEDMRVSGSNVDENFYRISNSKPLARINLTNEDGLFKQAVIAWNEEVSDTELAKGYDGKVFSTTGANMLYTMKGEHALAIQTITNKKEVVPLSYQVDNSGVYIISIDLKESNGQELYLRDKQTERVVNLSTESYSFNTAKGQFTDRFELVSNARVLGLKTKDIQVYAHKQTIHINLPEGSGRTFQLLSMDGQRVLSRTLARSAQIQTNLPAGVYIITDGERSHKIILK